MTEPSGPVLRSTTHPIRWNELCPWLILVRATRVALMVRVLLLALVGVALTESGWLIIEDYIGDTTGSDFARLDDFEFPEANLTALHDSAGPLIDGWRWAIQPLTRLAHASNFHYAVGYGVAGLWTMIVWGLFGGAIARIGAVYLTRGKLIGPLAALNFAFKDWRSTTGAPAMTFIGLVVMAIPLVLIGYAARLEFLSAAANFLMIVPLLLGLGFAIAAIGLLLGWPLMWATVAVERTDAFDAVSRSYAYVFQRPLHLLFYLAFATLLGTLAHYVLFTLLNLASDASLRLLALGASEEVLTQLKSLGADGDWSSQARLFWGRMFLGLSRSFPLAYLWPTAVAIYLLLRKEIDSAEMDVVSLGEDSNEPLLDQ